MKKEIQAEKYIKIQTIIEINTQTDIQYTGAQIKRIYRWSDDSLTKQEVIDISSKSGVLL